MVGLGVVVVVAVVLVVWEVVEAGLAVEGRMILNYLYSGFISVSTVMGKITLYGVRSPEGETTKSHPTGGSTGVLLI